MECEHSLSSPGWGMLWEAPALAKVLIPTHHPPCSTSRRRRGRTTKGPGEALGASGKEATGAGGGDVQTKPAEGCFFGFFPFPKGSSSPTCGVQLVWKRLSQDRSPGLSQRWVGIQVKQEPVPDQERGAWKSPLIYSVLVSPSGVFSVYLFFSREPGGPDCHRGAGLAQGRDVASVCSLLQKNLQLSCLDFSHWQGRDLAMLFLDFSRTSHPWEPRFPT